MKKARVLGLFLAVIFSIASVYALERQPVYSVSVTNTLTGGFVYSQNDRLGQLLTLPNVPLDPAGYAKLQSVTVVDPDKVSGAIDVLFFNDTPTIASADGAAIDVSDAEMLGKSLGTVSLVAADYVALANSSLVTKRDIQLPLKAKQGSTSLYALLVTRATTANYAGSTFQMQFSFDQM